ncbi:MAG: alpha/beta hydrolase fold domain-containing protein [Anaerolineales bacterium]
MSQSSTIHPELQGFARRVPKFSITSGNLWLWRFFTNLQGAAKPPKDVTIQDIFIPGKDKKTKIRLHVYKPKSHVGLVPGLVWLHGGGYVIGTPEIDDLLCIKLVQELGIVVISVDYRLAPQHPFPAALDDAYESLKWAKVYSRRVGIDNRIAIGGRSAGGGLAAALAQLAHDQKEIPLAAQLLIYPMLDDRTSSRTDLVEHEITTWSRVSNRFGWASYLRSGSGAGSYPEYAVSARRDDLSGLPPAWIGVGTPDLFHDEDVKYAKRLKDQGVTCELKIVDGAYHGFDVIAPSTQVARDFQMSLTVALRKHLFSAKQKISAVDLIPGKMYRIVKPFTDYNGVVHAMGECWKYLGHNFLPYEDGLTIGVEIDGKQRMFRMQWREELQAEIIDNFSEYVEEAA